MKQESPVYCIEYFQVKPAHRQELITMLTDFVAKSRKEEGCLQYDLLVDTQNPNLLIITMKYANQKNMAAHVAQPHIQAFVQNDMNRLCESVTWNDAHKFI
jgi:quinol monooxygenase YgiN